MIRVGVEIMLFSFLLYYLADKFLTPGHMEGANIGAGIAALFAFFVFAVGALVTFAGMVWWLMKHLRGPGSKGHSVLV